jgi:UDP-N-acetylglucosamine 2-epimerase (non-hydrolysing)
MTIAIILGTRPEIIKMAPVIRECQRRGLDYSIIHTGQHYSYQMDRIFFEQLELPQPDHNLDVGSGNHGEQTGRILADLEAVLMAERPDVVLVQGDTNTVMAGALAASKLHIKVGHVEAGLRSYDRSMPEEINRVVADHVSDYCFAPTEISKANLLKEGIAEEKIHVTGNTVVDSVYQNLEIAMRKVNILADLGLEPKGYFLVTSHRQENVTTRSAWGRSSGACRWSRASSACRWSSGPPQDEEDGRELWFRARWHQKPLSRWIPGVSAAGGQCPAGADGLGRGAGGSVHPGRALRDVAG